MGGALKLLQVGQTVQVQYEEFSCKVTVLPPGQAGPRVTEVGVDYVVLEDESEGIITRIPMHLLKAVGEPQVAPEPAPEPVPAAA